MNYGSCPRCGGLLVERVNKKTNQKFLACSNFFDNGCRYTCSINDRLILAKKFAEVDLGINSEKIISTWNEDFSLCCNILRKDITNEEEEYINSIFGKDSLSHHRDKRSPFQLAFDLVLSWFIEDAIIMYLRIFGYNIALNGGDKNRDFHASPIANPDFKTNINGKEIFIEQVTNFTGKWFEAKTIPLRDDKYKHLSKKNIYLLGIDLQNNYFVFFNVMNRNVDHVSSFKPYGGKPAYLVEVYEEDFYPFEELKNINKML